ncbi:CAAX prenyl protease 2 isoform X2 [Aquarana catesbeiana]|uniref:CAAX prenyl protease 2 isoform X2 n=1 Tax=Aquarana catesbeiana TaxID=8400 RepID=UPI003CCA2A00
MSEDHEGDPGSGLCRVSILCCLTLACSYVGSLYVWKSDLPRDHPAVIKRRFTSVLIVSSLSPLFLSVWKELTGIKTDAAFLSLMGFRLESILTATVLPLLLTMILFLGPLVQLSMDCPWDFLDGLKVAFDPRFWILCITDMRWLRNQVIAPLTEELVFRACMLPMLVPCTSPGTAIFTCPLFFGIGEKRLRQQSEDPRDPRPRQPDWKVSPTPPRIWRKERWRKWKRWAPHQVMLWLWKRKRRNVSAGPAPKPSFNKLCGCKIALTLRSRK